MVGSRPPSVTRDSTTASPSPTPPQRRPTRSFAIASAATWGEARRVATRYTWNPVGPEYYDPDEGLADDEPFDIAEMGAVQDGDWPPMVTTRASTLLPKDLQAAFSDPAVTALTRYYLEIPLRHEADLMAQLRDRGFEVSRDDDLINLLDARSFQ
jgi:hypothetical protein